MTVAELSSFICLEASQILINENKYMKLKKKSRPQKTRDKKCRKKNVWQVDMFVLLSSFIDILMLVYRRSLEQYSTIALTFNYEEKLVSHERKTT